MPGPVSAPRRGPQDDFDEVEPPANDAPPGRAGDPPARGVIAALFRLAAKAAASDDEKPKSRQRRKRGETEGQFRQLVRRVMRRFDLRPQFKHAASRTGRRSMSNSAALETFAAGSAASPWSNPLIGIDLYGGDLAGFGDFDHGFDAGPEQVSLDC
jgi:hypothetical protein